MSLARKRADTRLTVTRKRSESRLVRHAARDLTGASRSSMELEWTAEMSEVCAALATPAPDELSIHRGLIGTQRYRSRGTRRRRPSDRARSNEQQSRRGLLIPAAPTVRAQLQLIALERASARRDQAEHEKAECVPFSGEQNSHAEARVQAAVRRPEDGTRAPRG
jgi:hypothetical protein